MADAPKDIPQTIVDLLAALSCGAAVIDPSGVIVEANAPFCRMARRSSEQVVGASLAGLYPEEADRAHIRDMLERFSPDNDGEFHLPLPDGSKLPVIFSAQPVNCGGTLSNHRLVTVIDNSKHKAAEQSLKQQYDFIVQISDTVLAQALELKKYSTSLEELVAERTANLQQAHMDTIYMLAVASEAKDQDTGQHVRRVERYSRELARRVRFSESESDQIGYSSILHDIGKIHVPDEILGKPGPLDTNERARMQLHTLAGERILGSGDFFHQARRIARSHHENWDGSGYPDGLSKEQIPVEARIVHLADVYDALTNQRAYKQAWSHDQAADAIHQGNGTMFDPAVVRAFDSAVASGALVSHVAVA